MEQKYGGLLPKTSSETEEWDKEFRQQDFIYEKETAKNELPQNLQASFEADIKKMQELEEVLALLQKNSSLAQTSEYQENGKEYNEKIKELANLLQTFEDKYASSFDKTEQYKLACMFGATVLGIAAVIAFAVSTGGLSIPAIAVAALFVAVCAYAGYQAGKYTAPALAPDNFAKKTVNDIRNSCNISSAFFAGKKSIAGELDEKPMTTESHNNRNVFDKYDDFKL